MSMDRIIEMTEVEQPSDNDYVHLQSPTLGDRRIKANNLGNGGGGESIDGIYYDGTDVNTLRVIPLSENKDIEIEIDFYLPSYQSSRMILGNTANGYYPCCFMNGDKFTVNTGGSQIFYAPPSGFVGNHNLILNRLSDRAIILDGENIGTYTRQLVGQAPALDIGRALSIDAAEFVLHYLKITDYSTGEVLADYRAGFRALSNGYKIPCLLNTVDGTYIDLNTGRPSGNNNGHIMICQNPN